MPREGRPCQSSSGIASARQVGAEVQLAVDNLRDDETDRGEQGHDEHVPEVAERYGQAEGEPDHDADSSVACHVISHSNLTRPYLTRGGGRCQPIRCSTAVTRVTSNGLSATTTIRAAGARWGSRS